MKEVIDLNKTQYKLMFSSNDARVTYKLLSFDNNQGLSLNQSWNLFDHIITRNAYEIMAIIATKTKVFIACSTESGYEEILRALLIKFGTDLNLREMKEGLALVRTNSPSEDVFKNMDNITITIRPN